MFLLFFFFLGIRFENFACFQYFLLKVNSVYELDWKLSKLKVVENESGQNLKVAKADKFENWQNW